MIRIVALLCLVAAASAFDHELWKYGLKRKYDFNPMTWESSSFVDLPRNRTAATNLNWTMMTRPTKSISSGYDALELWVDPNDYTNGILLDENGQIAGLQISIPFDGLESYYDMEELGFTTWTYTNATGVTVKSWSICVFFVSDDKETRMASYNESKLLREPTIMLEGIGGLTKVPINRTDIDKVWTKDATVPLMGLHYFFNISETQSCEKPLFPWFLLYDEYTNQLIGIGLCLIIKSPNLPDFETPILFAIKLIMQVCPECLLVLIEEYGFLTLHFYFVDKPWLISG